MVHLELASPSTGYKKLWEQVPRVFVGSVEYLVESTVQLVETLAYEYQARVSSRMMDDGLPALLSL